MPTTPASDQPVDPTRVVEGDVARAFRSDRDRVLANLVGVLGDLQLAEDALQHAMEAATRRWPVDGVPASPAGWLTTVARNRAIDEVRRARRGAELLLRDAATPSYDQVSGPELLSRAEEVFASDDRLRLMFTCCHPALSLEARVALTLKTLGGLSTEQVARSFLVSEAAMARRLSRAKTKIREARIPYRVPGGSDFAERLDGVLTVLYLIYTSGSDIGGHAEAERLCGEALRLAALVRELVPEQPEAAGLESLLLFTEARRHARVADDGALVLLADQERAGWDWSMVGRAVELLESCVLANRVGRFQLEAAIQAAHVGPAEDTDWAWLLLLYDRLREIAPTPVVDLNRAVVVAEVAGAAAGLEQVDRLNPDGYLPWHAARAALLGRCGRHAAARTEHRSAEALAGNAALRRYHREQAARLS